MLEKTRFTSFLGREGRPEAKNRGVVSQVYHGDRRAHNVYSADIRQRFMGETLRGSTTFWVLAIGLAPAHVGWSANARHWRWGEGWEPRAASRRQGPALALGASCRLAAPGASPGAPSNAGGRKAGT